MRSLNHNQNRFESGFTLNVTLRPTPQAAQFHEGAAVIDVYESGIDEAGRFGAVFERDNETAYFYLLDMRKQEGGKIISAFNASTLVEMSADTPVSIRWSSSEDAVGLFVGGTLSAIFDLRAAAPTGRWADPEDGRLFPVS